MKKSIDLGKEIMFLLPSHKMGNTRLHDKTYDTLLRDFLVENGFTALFEEQVSQVAIFINRTAGGRIAPAEMKYEYTLNKFKVFLSEKDSKIEERKLNALYKLLIKFSKKFDMAYIPLTFQGNTFLLRD